MQIGVNKMDIFQIYFLMALLMTSSSPGKIKLTDSQIENAKGFEEGRVDKISKEDEDFLQHVERKYLEKKNKN